MNDAAHQKFGWGRRKSLRRHFGYPGQLHHGDGSLASACTIIDMSETGAQLEVPVNTELPFEFWLLIGGHASVRRRCRLVWRSGNRLGVQFRASVVRPVRSTAQATRQA